MTDYQTTDEAGAAWFERNRGEAFDWDDRPTLTEAGLDECRLVLLEVRDSTYEFGQPWFSWVVLDALTDEIAGYFSTRTQAEKFMYAAVSTP